MNRWHLTPAQNIGQPVHQQLQSARREGGLISAIIHLAWCGIIAVYLRVYHRISIVGQNRLPASGPFVLVSNHASHLDTLVLASSVRWRLRSRVFPVAAGDTFFPPG